MNDIISKIDSPLSRRLNKPAFPLSSAYNPDWIIEGMMGPHVLWLVEWLSQSIELRPGMRVLDLGCGKATSSIFLAREFGVSVHATDLWINPSENWKRIQQAGVSDKVVPIGAEAHALPFAADYFDLIVSLDAYQYFGTDDLYLGYCTKFLKPGGQIGIVAPGLKEELAEVPDHIRPYWDWDFCAFHTPAWWCHHWGKTGLIRVETADAMPNGWKLWQEWSEICAEAGVGVPKGGTSKEAEMLRVDQGRTFGFTRVVGRKPVDVTVP
jgi:SAM-dependent methyltransferase